MKGTLKHPFRISESETYVAGTTVDITNSFRGCGENFYNCIFPNGFQVTIQQHKINITDYSPIVDWNALRFEFAAKAMQGILANPMIMERIFVIGSDEDKVARCALAHADALIKVLKNTEK